MNEAEQGKAGSAAFSDGEAPAGLGVRTSRRNLVGNLEGKVRVS